MRSWSVVFVALFALQLSSSEFSQEMHSLDVELIQESASMGSLVKHGATGKQALLSKAELKARNMVMLGDVATSRAKVEMAQKQLKQVLDHVGRKHPEFLAETQKVQDFVNDNVLGESNDNKKLADGYKKLQKILVKIDELEEELQKELDDEEAKRAQNRKNCASEIKRLEDEIAKLQQSLDEARQEVLGLKGDNVGMQDRIRASRDDEAGTKPGSFEVQQSITLEEMRKAYDTYWAETDDSAAVRNILMQALWMICYGFRSFRHDPYCVTLRKQPDFAEPNLPQGKADDPEDATYKAHKTASEKFSRTMDSTWTAQKKADAHAVNGEDGDVDMEKGFINNRAPWGVDPATDGEKKQLTHAELASRLDFLIQEAPPKAKVVGPIRGFIAALQTGTFNDAEAEAAAKAGESLVDALSGLDRQEGEAQHMRDQEWQQKCDLYREQVDTNAKGMISETNLQENKQQNIFKNENKIRDINGGVKGHESQQAMKAATIKDKMNECEKLEIESDAIIEVAKEELVNVQRLNSLLRFLAIGDDASDCEANPTVCCDNTVGTCIEGQGTCTWWTRGTNAHGKDLHGDTNKDKVFCACEYGFYGETCQLRKCKGFGRIRYKADQPGVCSNREICAAEGTCNRCDTETGVCQCHERYYHGKWKKCEKKWCPVAVTAMGKPVYAKNEADRDSECTNKGQGSCNSKRGKCECTANFWGPHCGYHKCQAADDQGKIMAARYRGTSPNACSGRGACNADDGTCTCNGKNYFGEACQLSSCDGDCSGKGTCNTLTGLCACNADARGGSCVEGAGCKDCNYKNCQADCSGPNNGMCDRTTGKCVCNTFQDPENDNKFTGMFNGKTCLEPQRKNKYVADWTRSMDSWGWSICKPGYLLSGIKRDGLGNALYNLAYGICEKPAEGGGDPPAAVPTNECYHENWWKKFDTAGGKFCRRGYFVAGLFRSHCNSLYCLEMAKCCRPKRSVWNRCKWEKVSENEETGEATVANPAFIVGFYRDEQHTLDGLTWFRSCIPYFYGADSR